MFKDEDQDIINIVSDSAAEKFVRDQYCQTGELIEEERACQTYHQAEFETQTDFNDALPRNTKIIIDNSKKLCDFLLRVYPEVTDQLVANNRSHAFDGYEVDWEEKAEVIECSHVLKHEDQIIDEEQQITSVSWNSTGSTIAASYGRNDHSDWCIHKSCISLWNIDRRNLDNKKADQTIDVSSCVTSIHFNSTDPALLAGGDFSGLVYIWDLSKEDDPLVVNSSKMQDGHQEPVSKVNWMPDDSGTRFKHKLMSISSDGKILIWEFNKLTKELKLQSGFIIQASSLPQSEMRIRNDTELGVSCLSFMPHDMNTFLLGTENGGVFKCSLSSRSPAVKGISSSIEFRSPVTFAYQPHLASVLSADASPFHHNLFTTTSMDTTLRVYSLLQQTPLLVIEPGCGYLHSVQWSPTRPSVVTASTEDGRLLFFDLKESSVSPLKVLVVDLEKKPVSTFQYNSKRGNIISTGGTDCTIRVWTLSSDLVQVKNDDYSVLNELAEEGND